MVPLLGGGDINAFSYIQKEVVYHNYHYFSMLNEIIITCYFTCATRTLKYNGETCMYAFFETLMNFS